MIWKADLAYNFVQTCFWETPVVGNGFLVERDLVVRPKQYWSQITVLGTVLK